MSCVIKLSYCLSVQYNILNNYIKYQLFMIDCLSKLIAAYVALFCLRHYGFLLL